MGVYKRKGKWEVRFTVGGVRYYRQVPEAANKAQALVAEASMRREVYEGNYGKELGAADFVTYCRETYLPHLKGHAKTYDNIRYKVEVLCRHFALKRLKDITQLAVEGYKRARLTGNSQLGRPRKPVTVKAEINTLSAILNYAVENGQLGTNPCRRVRFPKGSLESRRERILSDDEEARLLPLLRGEVAAAVRIALVTGMRRHEIILRRAGDFDPAARSVTFTRKGGKRKTLPLSDEAWGEFERLIFAAGPDGYLFGNRRGNNFTSKGSVFKNALAKAKIADFTFHDLRHTFASRLAASGCDPFVIRDYLGHSSVSMTDRYVSTRAEDLRAAVNNLRGAEVLPFARKTG
jgi:integrase